MGDGRCVLLPGGVEQYLESRRGQDPAPTVGSGTAAGSANRAAETRQAKKDLARIESQLAKANVRIARLHDQMAGAASDYARLAALQAELTAAQAEHEALEESWLETAEHLDRRENAR